MTALAERLVLLQQERNVMKKEIADAAGLSLMGYYRYERGQREPSASTLVALADFFNVSIDYLLGRTDVPEVYHSYRPNAETIAAMKEAEDISNGKIPSKTFNTVDELMEDLLSDVED